MNKTLAILGMVAVLAGATLHANAVLSASAVDANRTASRHVTMTPPVFSQLGTKAPVMARSGVPAPSRITPVQTRSGVPLAPTAADWAVFMHDSCHTCEISANAASNLSQAWTYVVAGGGQTPWYGSPVESDSTVCFTASDGYLYAVNRNTGADAWGPVLLGASGYWSGTPVIWQDRVVVGMYPGTGATTSLFCRSIKTGDSLWTTTIPSTPDQWMVHLSRPIVLTVGDTAYAFVGLMDATAGTARVVGLNMITGALTYDMQWTGNFLYGGLATDGTNLYVPLQTTGVVCIVPGTAPAFDTIWTQTPGPGSGPVNSTPVYCNKQVFVVKGALAGPESVYALDAASGEVNWSEQVGDGTMGLDLGSAAVDSANVYAYASNFSTSPYASQVMAFHQSDGGAAWSTYYTTTDGLADGGMAVTTGTHKRLYIGTGFGSTDPGHMIVLNALTGTLVQDLPYATDYIYNSVCRPNGGLYITTYGSMASGTLIGYKVNDGVPPANDVGVVSVIAPTSFVMPGTSVTPEAQIMNFGTAPESNIPVYCQIDSAGTTIYNHNFSYVGPLAPGDTADISFSPQWTTDLGGGTYNVTMFTALANDSDHSDDTAYRTTTVFVIMDTLVVPWAAAAPTIDGVINADEWKDALKLDISDVLGENGSPQPAGSAYFYCKHDSGHVYYAVDFPNYTGRVDYDQVGCYMDENHDGAWAADSSEGNHWFAVIGGADTVIYRASPSYWTRWSGPPPNGVAMSSLTSGHLQYEAYVLKGSNQWDYTLNNPYGQDTVGFYAYGEVSGGTVFAGTWPTTMPGTDWDNPTDYGTMILSHSKLAVAENPPVKILASKLTLGSNPATGSALVRYSVASPGLVSLKLYDISGKLVGTLARSRMAAGNYQTVVDASKLARGIYLLKFATNGYTTTAKLIID